MENIKSETTGQKRIDTVAIDIKKLNNTDLKLISNELILSNTGEAIVINKDYTKGIVLRGYSKKLF